MVGAQPTRSELDQMIRFVDSDQNGVIDFPEFLRMVSRTQRIDPDQEMRECFRAFDTNDDGRIDFQVSHKKDLFIIK